MRTPHSPALPDSQDVPQLGCLEADAGHGVRFFDHLVHIDAVLLSPACLHSMNTMSVWFTTDHGGACVIGHLFSQRRVALPRNDPYSTWDICNCRTRCAPPP
jgi:hypothetical protein